MSSLSWREAIRRVLENESEPLHYAEIAERIAELGLKTDVGATPAASVNAEISTSIKENGSRSPYERVSRGHYRLRQGSEPKKTSIATTPEPEE